MTHTTMIYKFWLIRYEYDSLWNMKSPILSQNVCGYDCEDIMERFDSLEDEVKTLKVKVNDLEAENLEMANKIEKLEVG